MSDRDDDLTPKALEEKGLRLIAEGQRLIARAEVRKVLSELEWVDQTNSPLGRRQHNELSRSGKIPARKVRGHWLVRRDDLNAYIEKHGLSRRAPRPKDEGVDDIIDRVMRDEGAQRR